jgi:hypothetical protein
VKVFAEKAGGKIRLVAKDRADIFRQTGIFFSDDAWQFVEAQPFLEFGREGFIFMTVTDKGIIL